MMVIMVKLMVIIMVMIMEITMAIIRVKLVVIIMARIMVIITVIVLVTANYPVLGFATPELRSCEMPTSTGFCCSVVPADTGEIAKPKLLEHLMSCF